MTDRAMSITVVLDRDIRVDDLQPTIDAILQLKGVLSADANVYSLEGYVAYERAREELKSQLWQVLNRGKQ